MAKVERSEMVCIKVNDGKPVQSLAELANDIASMAGLGHLESHYDSVVKRIAHGRRRVLITITVEDA